MPRKWEPSARDGMSLAAFRWFANTIENFAIELYATNRDTYPEVESILRNALEELKAVRIQFPLGVADDCPDGYVLCHGVCAPSCDFEAGDLAPQSITDAARGGKVKGKGKKR